MHVQIPNTPKWTGSQTAAQSLQMRVARSLWVVPACALLALIFVWASFEQANSSPGGEHFAWFNGTSSWPSVGILFFTMLLAVHFIVKSDYTLEVSAKRLSEFYGLSHTAKIPAQRGRSVSFFFDFSQLAWKTSAVSGSIVDMQQLWSEYLFRGGFFYRVSRTAPMALLYLAFIFLIMFVIGLPQNPPLRGDVPIGLVLTATVFVLFFLMFFIVDAMLLDRGFIIQLQSEVTHWPDDTFAVFGYGDRETNRYEIELAHFWDVMFIARRTVAVGNLIYYPFVILFLLIISRFPSFDNWVWWPATVVALTVNFLIAFYVAWQIPTTASAYRDEVLLKLKRMKRLRLMKETDCASDDSAPSVIDTMIDEIQSEHKGAFSYLWDQPAIRALLLPSTGVALVSLLQYIPR